MKRFKLLHFPLAKARRYPSDAYICPKDTTDSQNSRKEDMHIVLRHNVDGLGLGASLGFSRFLR